MEKTNTNKSSKIKRFYEPETSPLVDICEWQIDEEGHHILVKVGVKNFDDEIQLYKDACDIKVIIERMMNGDAATIKQLATPGLYGDVNDFPQEVHPRAYAQGLKQLYENQPASVKEKFPTYEMFEKYFTTLTKATIEEMYASKEKVKEEVKDGE